MRSYAAEVIADDSGKFAGNALRFATKEEAEVYVRDLARRWFLVRETRVVESEDPVTARLTKQPDGSWLPWSKLNQLARQEAENR